MTKRSLSKTKKYIILFLSMFLCFSLAGCSDTQRQARKATERYLESYFSGGEHSFQIIDENAATVGDYDTFTYTCKTDDDKYTFEVTPYKTYYEFPFAFTIKCDIKRDYKSNFATTIMTTMASNKYFTVADLSEESLLQVVEEMHTFADEIKEELLAYAANDYHKYTVLYVAQIDYDSNVYEYTYNSMVIKGKQYTDEDLVMLIRETIEGKD